ncbi:cysteine hydrolase family protein [Sciscionella marina]|uniref:cysteine hydrolase family protein n=1 Tax=Sciscionella marina TaxID=508770 RepID=UPI00037AD9ED|nr:isochorismatase family cysteine hydrolase [Sciscionella marina]
MHEDIAPHWPSSALLAIDLQHEFCTGAHAVPGTADILGTVRELVAAYRAAGLPIVHVIRLYLPDGSNAERCRRAQLRSGDTLVTPHSPGSQPAAVEATLDPELLLGGESQQLGPREWLLYKPRWSAFHGTGLLDQLTVLGTDTVTVAGCNYPNCPRATLIDATERDLRTVAVSDGLSGWLAEDLDGIGVVSLRAVDILAGIAG